jgi:hypothetical protein
VDTTHGPGEAAGDDAAHHRRRPTGRRWRPTRIIVVALVTRHDRHVGVRALPRHRPRPAGPPDRLDDPAFATAAQARCEAAHAVVGRCPPPTGSRRRRPGRHRGRSQRHLHDDAGRARRHRPLRRGRRSSSTAWLADWRIYLGDRERYADALRTDPEARLLVTPKEREQITEYIDAFAADNKMIACGTPLGRWVVDLDWTTSRSSSGRAPPAR